MPTAAPATKDSKQKNNQAQFADRSTRLLLALWESDTQTVARGKLTSRLKRKDEKASDYQDVFSQLEANGAISINQSNVEISPKGKQLLGQHLQSGDLEIQGTIVGAWVAKALCKWLQQLDTSTNGWSSNGKVASNAISSYEEFKPVALALFEKLNKGYNYGGLVPIWHMRRELGDQLERTEFNDWVMRMQADQLFYLQSGEAIGATDAQKQDSISSEIRGLLFYASLPA